MSQEKNIISTWDRIMMAVTFAEAGETKTAVDLLNRESIEQQQGSRLSKTEQRPELRL